MSELIERRRGKRILVVALKSMMTQLQMEWWTRFTIPLVRLDSRGIQRIRENIPANHNPFYYYDRSTISIDTLKRGAEYRTYVEDADWDIVVVDGSQNAAFRGHSGSQRHRLVKMLSRSCDTMIMVSATPHDGSPRSFASLMNMLDPTAIANPASLMGVYDVEKEEKKTADAMEAGTTPNAFDASLDAGQRESSVMDVLLGHDNSQGATAIRARVETPMSLFDDDVDFMETALNHLAKAQDLALDFDLRPQKRMIRLTATDEIRRRFQRLPDEAMPSDRVFFLSSDRDVVQQAVAPSRQRKIPRR